MLHITKILSFRYLSEAKYQISSFCGGGRDRTATRSFEDDIFKTGQKFLLVNVLNEKGKNQRLIVIILLKPKV